MSDNAMLDRLVNTLKREIAPAIDDEYLKTQAYMASVVVAKLARQLALETAHANAASADHDRLADDLRQHIDNIEQGELLRPVLDVYAEARDPQSLCLFIEALYRVRGDIGDADFTVLRGRVRESLRADIDRRMEYAR